MDEPGEYYIKWNKTGTERQISHDFRVESLKNWTGRIVATQGWEGEGSGRKRLASCYKVN